MNDRPGDPSLRVGHALERVEVLGRVLAGGRVLPVKLAREMVQQGWLAHAGFSGSSPAFEITDAGRAELAAWRERRAR